MTQTDVKFIEPIDVFHALRHQPERIRLLDVRSEAEFANGHFTGAKNIPILNNQFRHEVGLNYRLNGQAAAIELGHQLVEPHKHDMISQWSGFLRTNLSAEGTRAVVMCWRGGLRSQLASEWLQAQGLDVFRLRGGYKALRRVVLQNLQSPPPLLLVGGMTGVGKSEFLRHFFAKNFLDLEDCAEHRGSTFGSYFGRRQPTQQTFENRISLAMAKGTEPLLVEAESRLIGSCIIPQVLKEAMDQAPLLLLENSLSARIERIFFEYVHLPWQQGVATSQIFLEYTRALSKLARRLGGARHQELQAQLRQAFSASEHDGSEPQLSHHSQWIKSLLTQYYDPLYQYSLSQKQRPLVISGSQQELYEYIRSYLDRWRSRAHTGH